MQVKLIEEVFGTNIYDLEPDEKGLSLTKEEDKRIQIPFAAVKHFNMEGMCGKTKWFLLETEGGTYEGCFLNEEDTVEFIRLLRNKCGCYMDIRLDME